MVGGLDLQHLHRYELYLRPVDGAGGFAFLPSISEMVMVDHTPPAGGRVLDGADTRYEMDSQADVSGVCVTWDEFYDYYSDLSMSTPSDEYFVRMMESSWQIVENDDAVTTKSTVKHLHTEVKARVL